MNFSKWSVGKKLWTLSLLAFLVLVVCNVLTYFNTKSLTHGLNDLGLVQIPAVRYTTLSDMMHDAIRSTVLKAEMNQGNAPVLAEASEDLDKYCGNVEGYLAKISALELNENARKTVTETSASLAQYISISKKIVNGLNSGQPLADADKKEFEAKFDLLEESLEKQGDMFEKTANAHVEESNREAKEATFFNILIFAVGIVCFVFSSIVNRNLIATLQKIMDGMSRQADSLGDSSKSIGTTSNTLSSAVNQQASALQETAASLEEINSMLEKTSQNSLKLKESVENSSETVQTGQKSVRAVLQSMQNINESNENVRTEVNNSNEQIKEIVKVIAEIGEKTKVINDIVFQTKLLSFNASVEAARAGEHGKGFAVVAEEVGNLAQMSGTAAKEISSMLDSGIQKAETIVADSSSRVNSLIQTGHQKTEEGNRTATECGNSFEEIVGQVQEVNIVTSEINNAIAEQTKGLSEINRAISLLDQSTQENSKTAEQAAKTGKELLRQFETLSELVAELKGLVYGKIGGGGFHATHRTEKTTDNDETAAAA